MDERLKRYPMQENMKVVESRKVKVPIGEVNGIVVEIDDPAETPRKVPGIFAFIEKCRPLMEEDGFDGIVFRRKKPNHSTEVTP